MMVNKVDTSASSNNEVAWHSVNWKQCYLVVNKLQVRIVKAVQQGKWNKVKALQHLLVSSFSGKVIAIRRVTENRGKKTSGVDNILWSTPTSKSSAIGLLKRRGYNPLPLRRVYIPKSNGKKRALSIPTMKDRAMQALYKLALEPIAETLADRHSYGFRPERSTADAIEQCYIALSRKKGGAEWVLEADIEGCFDNISHEWLLANIPMDKVILLKWLKAGYMDRKTLHATRCGVPQGGIISPILANIALDGLDKELSEKFPMKISSRKPAHKVNFIRYADDFIVTGRTEVLLRNEVLPLIKEFLAERGLKLSEAKSRITHINHGFDFLGMNIRKFEGKLLIQPSKRKVCQFLRKIKEMLVKHRMIQQKDMINLLNPIIGGWVNYYRHVSSKSTFSKVRHELWKKLWRWSRRRHGNKGAKWIKNKYFIRHKGQDWCFAYVEKSKGENDKGKILTLFNPAKVPIKRHTKVQADLNPYDPEWRQYLEKRTKEKMLQSLRQDKLKSIWESQTGVCPVCKQRFTPESEWELHHVKERSKGGTDEPSNLVMLHPNCHKQVHNRKFKVTKPGSRRKSLIKSLSRMMGNYQVRFLEGGVRAISLSYSTLIFFIVNITLTTSLLADDHEAWINTYLQNLEMNPKYIEDANDIREQSYKKLKDALFDKDNNQESNNNNKLQKFDKYIFVSSSMPKKTLANLAKEAKENRTFLVLRGLIENNYLKTASYLQDIIEQSNNGFIIDPELFKLYKVTQVPTFVVSTPLAHCSSIEKCSATKYDKLSGNVSLNYALAEITNNGELMYE